MITIGCCLAANLLAQVNVVPINGGLKLKPTTVLLPNTQVTPTNITSNNWSEPDYCTTPDLDTTEFKQLPWYGNEQYLDNLLDSVGYPNPCANCQVEQVGVRYRIPVVFWVYNNDAGSDNTPTDIQIRATLKRVNQDHRNSDRGFRFYIPCDGIRRINSDELVEVSIAESTINDDLTRAGGGNFVKGAINIHVIRNDANFYNPLTDAIFVERDRITDIDLRITVTHEIGHALGLQHTHLFSSFQPGPGFGSIISKLWVEPIDRSRTKFSLVRLRSVRICSINGDGLCDTPADPRLRGGENYNERTGGAPTCQYFDNPLTPWDDFDPWGDRYDNPPAGSRSPEP